jgi:hypothetical protein
VIPVGRFSSAIFFAWPASVRATPCPWSRRGGDSSLASLCACALIAR